MKPLSSNLLRSRSVLCRMTALALTLVSSSVFAPASAVAALSGFGPIDPSHGFPIWYEDTLGQRLEFCIDPADTLCLPPAEPFDPSLPLKFPNNFPEEAFWWTAETELLLPNGGNVLLVMALEAAFASSSGLPEPGQQIAFARIRIRAGGLAPGTYRITHPYGVETFVVSETEKRQINYTEDIGLTPGAFGEALTGRIGPFLKWDPTIPPAAPTGYLGDPNVRHSVIGSPFDTNYLAIDKIEGLRPVRIAETNTFFLSGKLSKLSVYANPKSGTFTTPPQVTLTASDPTAQIFYTADSTDPATSPTRILYTGPITPTAPSTTLMFMALATSGAQSMVGTETYIIDPDLLTVTASPVGNVYSTAQDVVLSASDPSAALYYTLDGSNPINSPTRVQYDAPIPLHLNGTYKLKFAAVLPSKQPAVFNEIYNIRIPVLELGPIHPAHGFPIWYEDANGRRLELCLNPNDPLCGIEDPDFDTTAPLRFPENFPEEAFWWAGEADVVTSGGGNIQLVMALEAAFNTATGLPADSKRVAFGRIRIRGGGLAPGVYRITHPYGVEHFLVNTNEARQINFTEDVMPVSQDFTFAQASRIGPFLYWDPAVAPAAPLGYVGDPNTLHRVLGSPYGTNFFRVERIVNGVALLEGVTDLFTVTGKLAGLSVHAGPAGGVYPSPPLVTLTASDPGASIFYTQDLSDPVTSPSRVLYSAPIATSVTGTTLIFYADDGAGNTSPVVTETYSVDATAPTVNATPRGGSYSVSQFVTLTASEPSTLFFTTDGTDPKTSAVRVPYMSPIPINLVGLTVLKFVAIDQAGNASATMTENYLITDTSPTVTAPVASLSAPTRLPTNAATVTISWSGEDDLNQIDRFELEDRVNGGAFSPIPLVTQTANALTLQLAFGSTHQFRVRAIDAEGNASEWAVAPVFRVAIDQETARAVRTSGRWIRGAVIGASGGGVRSSTSPGARARYDFTGTSIAWISTMSPRRGIADIEIDGVPSGSVDLYSPTQISRQVVFATTGLSPGPHQMTITVRGQRNPLSTSNQVDIDAFVRLQ